ncbi:neural/ectodermal development factor IMP-L2 isoform X2 [Anoplophora glabripennis]|uniref:neural/ectodermal development factor IMP-L2 isoform X1 n=1 Tax=Anoplophora glabripennis TaxID=217634 RepID=UPI00087409FD|nr:neural/ectodermal development factor IMP-L2 isoform X1 [Anoplophora glabripennis]XP_018565969.1 neural/ectodermal development factor IMP-L2 isoform X2 [Anoplophora glabripennis]
MMILSVLLIALSLRLAQSSRLRNDMNNDLSPVLSGSRFKLIDWVQIKEPPVPLVTEKVGAHVELECQAMGSPPPTIQWYKRNMRITENEMMEVNTIKPSDALAMMSSRLVINYLLPRHQDIYRCVAEAGAQVSTSVTKLIVSDKEGREMNFTQLINAKILGAHHMPRVTFWASTLMDTIGNEVNLPCKSVGNPKPTLLWIDPNGRVIETDDRFTILPDGELRIKSIIWADMGIYTCVVKNSVGDDTVETFLYPMKASD